MNRVNSVSTLRALGENNSYLNKLNGECIPRMMEHFISADSKDITTINNTRRNSLRGSHLNSNEEFDNQNNNN